jgi:hypothetical protein
MFIKEKYCTKFTTPISNEVYISVSKSTINLGTNKNLKSSKFVESNSSSNDSNHNTYTGNLMKNKTVHQPFFKYEETSNSFLKNNLKTNGFGSNQSFNETRYFRNTTNDRLMNSTLTQENLIRINE